jgi:hypothetical protein
VPDWAVVLVAAFGGGLAGAVLQPIVSHVLERASSKERIRRSRERCLRHMLSAWMSNARRLIGVSIIAYGFPPDARATELRRIQAMHPEPGTPPWQPERIVDDELRLLAVEHNRLLDQMFGLLWQSQLDQKQAETLPSLCESIREIQPKITARMDELNWPEVDD